eukprot:gnl/MRDRNA2_/MRDRNA2_33943_c0_seq1.p2 gnl/MRDRNA2_/MRDRNA2_33943_c0~~gnl/MRDRNA2_/MRDRNA2_33943_c0_seq1.p2  ORF type:complete len:224 (+),score=49.15 gnl/MRDRNA2_/MRDRNA2_33943_c0_seq1:79-750(+)
MPAPHPQYDPEVPNTHCRIRVCNAYGEEFAGQPVPVPFAVSTLDTKGIVPRKGAFTYDQKEAEMLLSVVFAEVPGGDWEKCSKDTKTKWAEHLDKIDLTPIDYNDCDAWINEMVPICEQLTREATGKDWSNVVKGGCEIQVEDIFKKALRHTVRMIWMRDYEWEALICFLSDPNGERSVEEMYHTPSGSDTLKFNLLNKCLVFLQAWHDMITPPEDPKRRGRR